MSLYRLVILTVSCWIMAEGLLALFLVYPPTDVWIIVRFIRIFLGALLLLEARRIRTILLSDRRSPEIVQKYASAYMDLLDFIGVWLIVDGIGTGFLGYIYPILIWQIIRLMRFILGLGLALGSHFIWFRRLKNLKASK